MPPVPELVKRLVRPSWRFLRKRMWLARRHSIIPAYLKDAATPKLQIGAGFNGLDGWLNGDILPRKPGYIYLDATKSLPFANDTFAFVYSEHMIEHIDYRSASDFVRASCGREECCGSPRRT